MDSSFPNGPVYAPTQPPDKNQSLSSSSNRMRLSVPHRPYPSSPHVASQQAPQISHSLPSMYDENESLAYRNLASQTAMISSHLYPVSQAGSYPSYIPNGLPQANSPNSPYAQHQQSLSAAQAYSSQSSNPQPYQPYLSSHPASGRLPDIRPMPAGGLNEPSSLASAHRISSSSNSLTLHDGQEAQPTHVVGSQGRRGILPSAVGRPAAVPIGSANGQKTANVPTKDAEGKFPCPHCAKTYLHAKHLKRHLLRHTGTRPYSCGLCKDTFSRSDILKRHFQKCSVRRGNPTGESHLSHSRATKKSNQAKALEASASQPEKTTSIPPAQTTAIADFSPANLPPSFDLSTLGITGNYLEDNHSLLNRQSRSNSIKRPSNGGLVANPGIFSGSSSSSYDSANFSYSGGHVTPDSITTSGAATPYPYSNETRANNFTPDTSFGQSVQGQGAHLTGGIRAPAGSGYLSESLPQIVGSSVGRGTDADWPSLFTANGTEEYNNAQFHSDIDNCPQPVKSEQDFSNMSFTLPQEYPPYLPTKV